MISSEREKTFLDCSSDLYRTKADAFSQQQICIDLFTFAKDHQQRYDLAITSVLARNTDRQVHCFPTFHSLKDGENLYHSLFRSLRRETSWKSVIRIRASNSIKGSELFSSLNCDGDISFGFEFAHEEGVILNQPVTVQAALLFTTSDGERRIRVTTQYFPFKKNHKLTSSDCCIKFLEALP